MDIFSFDFKNTPITIREQFQNQGTQKDLTLGILKLSEAIVTIQSLIILNTCNRTEFIVEVQENNLYEESFFRILEKKYTIEQHILKQYCKIKKGLDARKYLIELGVGLNSMVLGETEIQGQLKRAYREAQKIGTISTHLDDTIQGCFSIIKEVRTEANVNRHKTSIATIALKLVFKIFDQLDRKSVLVIGVGEIAEQLCKILSKASASKITIANRTLAKAQEIAQKVRADIISLSQVPATLDQYDIVISIISNRQDFLSEIDFRQSQYKRKYKNTVVIDLGLPRNIESTVATLSNLYLYSLENVESIANFGLNQRRGAGDVARKLIVEKVEKRQLLEQNQNMKKSYLQCLHQNLESIVTKYSRVEGTDLATRQLLLKVAQDVSKKQAFPILAQMDSLSKAEQQFAVKLLQLSTNETITKK